MIHSDDRNIKAKAQRFRERNADQQRALRLLLLEEYSYQAVAEAMDAELNTVRSWIRRARATVRCCVAYAYGLTLEDQ